MSFAQNFKIIKEMHEISNYKIAKSLKCSQSTVANWLKGDSEPTPSQVANIAQILNCNVSDLIEGNKKSPSINDELNMKFNMLTEKEKAVIMEKIDALLK